jgi:GTP-binding protein
LIADVGLIGLPNAGKSTLLSRLTRAHPKIAAYPFTTLFPNLGVASVHEHEIILADIPGLIEGSHTGKGLGHEFLQHIERTRFLVHVVDPLGYGGQSPQRNIKIINQELKSYSKELAKKPQLIVVNKQDLSEAEAVFKALKKSLKKTKVMAISGVSGQGIKELLGEIDKQLERLPLVAQQESASRPVHFQFEPEFWIEKEEEIFVVKGKKVETLVAMTPMNLPQAVERTQHILKKIGVERALLAKGAQTGDYIRIAGVDFNFEPEFDETSFRRKPESSL